jgi:urease accessory protein
MDMTMDMTTAMATPTAPAAAMGTEPAAAAPPALDPAALLQLIWLASPALPVGGFSYSEGLEPAIDAGLVHDEASTARWLGDQLALTLQRADGPLLAAAMAAWAAHDAPRAAALNAWALQTRETREFRQQAEQMGRSLFEWLRQRQPGDPRVAALGALTPAPTWPVAFALAAVHTGAPLREALLAHSFGWAENMVQAAIKAVPLGQSAGQRMLAALSQAIPGVVDEAMALADEQRQACSPMLAILSARHEAQYSRLFRS